MAKREFSHLADHLAPIEPILITGTKLALQEFQKRYPGETIILSIITPCKTLTVYDNQPILTWKDYREGHRLNFLQKSLDKSPCPWDSLIL